VEQLTLARRHPAHGRAGQPRRAGCGARHSQSAPDEDQVLGKFEPHVVAPEDLEAHAYDEMA
jgi:hypothetical protein